MICVNDYSNSMVDCLEQIESIDIFKSGKKKTINKTNKEFALIFANLKELFEEVRVMPAFGVSLHNETLNELQNGNWLQLNFSRQMDKNGLLFNSLLFKLEKTNGINLIRLFNDNYEGRCIYLDFDNEIDLNLILNTLDN